MKPNTGNKWVLAALAISLIVWAGVIPRKALAQEEVVQIRITKRHVDEILPAAKPLLSSRGFISADQRTNSLIVIDNPEAIARIRRLVQELDLETPLLIIRVQYADAAADGASEANAPAGAGEGKTTAESDPEPVRGAGDETDAYALRTKSRRQSEYVIRVRSGGMAYIEVGYDVPQRKRWQQLSQRYGYISETVVFQRVASGYNVRPVLVGDQVQIDIVPRINYFDNRGRDQQIHFAEAATTLVVTLDNWIDISGVMGGHREINRQILADSQHAADHQLTMRLMVSVDR